MPRHVHKTTQIKITTPLNNKNIPTTLPTNVHDSMVDVYWNEQYSNRFSVHWVIYTRTKHYNIHVITITFDQP